AVRVGEADVYGALVVERLDPPGRTVNELVRQHERARSELRAQSTDRARGQDLPYAERAQGPQVGPVRDAVRGITVVAPVAGQERDAPAADLGDGDPIRGIAVRRGDVVLFRPVEQAVEAGAPDDADVRQHTHGADSNREPGRKLWCESWR